MYLVISDIDYSLLSLKYPYYKILSTSKNSVAGWLTSNKNPECLLENVDLVIIDICLNTFQDISYLFIDNLSDDNSNSRLFECLYCVLIEFMKIVQSRFPGTSIIFVERPLYTLSSFQLSASSFLFQLQDYSHPLSEYSWACFKSTCLDFQAVMTVSYRMNKSLDRSLVLNYFRTDSFLTYKNISMIADVHKRAASIMSSKPFKLIVLDLDNTLWSGTLLEDGIDNLIVGGASSKGKLHFTFQELFKRLKEHGVLLAVVSKNNQQDVEAALRRIKSPLNYNDFTAIIGTFDRKSKAIARIAEELNITPTDIVFIDDSFHEQCEVKEELPEVTVLSMQPDRMSWPQEITSNTRMLKTQLICSLSKPNDRTSQYKARRMRNGSKSLNASKTQHDEWLAQLNQQIFYKCTNLISARANELFLRVNQFNMQGSKYSPSEISVLLANDYRLYEYSVQDKYGMDGVVALTLTKAMEDHLELHNMLLSCRVFNRNIEHSILRFIYQSSITSGLQGVRCNYTIASTNKAASTFFTNITDSECYVNPKIFESAYTVEILPTND